MESEIQELLYKIDSLSQQGLSKDEIIEEIRLNKLNQRTARIALSRIDNVLVDRQLINQFRDGSKLKYTLGFFLALIGCIVTIGTYSLNYSKFYLWIGPIICGAYLIYDARLDDQADDADLNIRKRRIFKRKFDKF